MIGKLKGYFLNDEISKTGRALIMVLSYTIFMLIVISIPGFIYLGSIGDTIFILLGSSAVLSAIAVIAIKTGRYNEAAVTSCYFVNIICMPLIFVFGGGIKAGLEFLFIPGIINTVLLLKGLNRKMALLTFAIWYTILLTFTSAHPETIHNEPFGQKAVNSIIVNFAVGALIQVIVVLFQRSLLRVEHEKVEAALRSSRTGSQTKSRFLANMSHELRTPMNAIMGMAELMEKEDTEHAVKDEIEVIRSTAEGLLTTINAVLTYSKLESGKLEMMNEQFGMDKLIWDIMTDTERKAEEKGIVFQADIAPDIPNVLYGDASKITKILEDLLNIAVDHTESGRVTMSLSGKKNREGTKITIFARITDTGIGIARDDLENIYASYETYDSRKDSRLKQLGLELTICRGMLRMMNGNMEYESLADVGSTANISFECFIVERDQLVDVSALEMSRVLIACSSDYRRQIWRSRLSAFKTIIDFASTIQEFGEKIENNRYSYIFLQDTRYEDLKGFLTEERLPYVYVLTDLNHSLGDFGRCRIIRRPVNTLNLADIFCDRWNAQEYERSELGESFIAPEAMVMVVDDNMVNLQVAGELLKRYAIDADLVRNGHEAVGRFRQKEYDLILLDRIMPGMDGVAVLQELRRSSKGKDLPIVCLTADFGSGLKESLQKMGFSDYLAKPMKNRYLEEILQTYLPRKKILRPEDTDYLKQMGNVAEKKKAQKEPGERESGEKPVLPGVDMEEGLSIVGGDMTVYHLILNVYHKEGLEKLKIIPEAFTAEDGLKRFTVETHAVKGSSANIGAKELSSQFKALEFAGKAGNRVYIEEHLDRVMNTYASLLAHIKDYLIENNAYETE